MYKRQGANHDVTRGSGTGARSLDSRGQELSLPSPAVVTVVRCKSQYRKVAVIRFTSSSGPGTGMPLNCQISSRKRTDRVQRCRAETAIKGKQAQQIGVRPAARNDSNAASRRRNCDAALVNGTFEDMTSENRRTAYHERWIGVQGRTKD